MLSEEKKRIITRLQRILDIGRPNTISLIEQEQRQIESDIRHVGYRDADPGVHNCIERFKHSFDKADIAEAIKIIKLQVRLWPDALPPDLGSFCQDCDLIIQMSSAQFFRHRGSKSSACPVLK